MAKTDQLLRIKYIEELLRRKKDAGASFEEIQEFLEKKFREKDKTEDLQFSDRTFHRDKKMIQELSGIEIEYSRSRNVYFIQKEELDLYEENIFDNMLLIEAYRETKSNGDIMIFEPRKSRGLENLHGLIHAIKLRKIIGFTYLNFWTTKKTQRLAEPYALKEFEHRWYLLAKDHRPKDGNQTMKTFALDRLSDLDIKTAVFRRENYNPEEAFRHSFGIIAPNGEKPQEIVLQFDAHQGNYIKALPLHSSQKLVSETETETVISVFVVPTYDFEREILSYGNRVKIISPESFKEKLRKETAEMLKNFE